MQNDVPLRELDAGISSSRTFEDSAQVESSTDTRNIEQTLGRVDGGFKAWTVLSAAFVFEAILWGFPLSYGIFQNYYYRLPEFKGSPYIAYVGTIATGIPYLGAPLMSPFVKRFPQYQRHMIVVGWILCIAGLVSGSFANTPASLVLTQGVLYGIGYLIIFYPIVNMVNEWWVARRGFAYGFITGASGASGVAYPFILEALLASYGYRTTLRSLAVATALLTLPLLPFFKGRLPPSPSNTLARTDWTFVRKPLFWLYAASTIAQSLGFYLPGLYLPSYASATGFGPRIGALLIAIMSIAQVLGQFTYGHLSDGRWPLNTLLLSSSLVAAIASLTLWGLARSLAPLILFAVIYGFFAYAYLAMRMRMGTATSADPNAAFASFCILSSVQGVGNVLAGPISGALLGPVLNFGDYGHLQYKPMVIFTGCTMVASVCAVALSSTRSIKVVSQSQVY